MEAALVLFIYLAPWIVAGARGHSSVGGIAVINLFLGWTLIGWVVALAWACSDGKRGAAK